MRAVKHTRRKLTVPAVAERFGVAEKKILEWIRSGELRAINLATTTAGRPRFAVDLADLAAFEAARQVLPTATSTPRRARRQATNVKTFF